MQSCNTTGRHQHSTIARYMQECENETAANKLASGVDWLKAIVAGNEYASQPEVGEYATGELEAPLSELSRAKE